MTSYAPPEITALRREVHRLLDAGEVGAALDRIRLFVDSILFNPRAVTRVLASVELDDLCLEIAQAVGPVTERAEDSSAGTVILASELAKAGGHIEVMKDCISLGLFEEPLSMLLTDCFDRADPNIASEFADTFGLPVRIAEGPDTGARFEAVREMLDTANPSTLALFFHHQDSIGMCAALAAKVPDTVFVHHADHHLSLGVTCKDFRHVDLANMAFENCRHELGIHDNVYWPLVLRKDVGRRERDFSKVGGWTSCSVGRSEKFMADGYAFDYASLLPKILKTTGGTHVHIGNVPEWLRKSLEDSFEGAGVSLDRIRFIPYAPSVAQALVDEDIDFVLGSFPVGGGKSTIEAMAAGLPLVMHLNYRHRMFCGADVAYPGALTWSDDEELIATLARLTPELLSEHAQRAREWFERHHSGDALVRAARNPSQSPPPLVDHPHNRLFAFLDEERALREKFVPRAELAAAEMAAREAGKKEAELTAAETARQEAEKEASRLAEAVSERDARVREIETVHAALLERTRSPEQLIKLLAASLKTKLRRKKNE